MWKVMCAEVLGVWCAQAVTRHILTIGQELTFAKERVALLDEAPRSNGPSTPQPVCSSTSPQAPLTCTVVNPQEGHPHTERPTLVEIEPGQCQPSMPSALLLTCGLCSKNSHHSISHAGVSVLVVVTGEYRAGSSAGGGVSGAA